MPALSLTNAAEPASPADTGPLSRGQARSLFALSLLLFFAWGFATVLIDILIPKFKGLFALSYAEAMLTQFAFFLGYFVFSLPAGRAVARLGYMRGIVLGLLVMAGGALLFIPAGMVGLYWPFLVALFVMAAGITILQVAANAVISLAGDAGTSSARLTLAQAFNSLGTFIGPYVGARLLLEGREEGALIVGEAERGAAFAQLQLPYTIIGGLLLLLAAIFFLRRNLLGNALQPSPAAGLGLDLLRQPRLLFGVIAIFAYVGAEVAIGSLLVAYLAQPEVLGLSLADAGKLVALYWGAAMVGRFVGAALLSRVPAGLLLALFAAGAIALSAVSGLSGGTLAAVAIIAVGLANSIMFPTIFSQAVLGLGGRASEGAALLCMAIVGGAILPVLAGAVADAAGLAAALIVPVLGYAWVLFYGWWLSRRPLTGATV